MKSCLHLENFEYSWFSQDYEEGICEEIFFHIGTSSQYYVEFGASDGLHASNTRKFREEFGWSGLLLDCHHENPFLNLHKTFVNAENINFLFQQHQVPCEFDLLSIDIDSNDFYVWHALSSQYQPRLVIIEYNALHSPFEDKVIVYHPKSEWDRTDYFGASILALFNLGRKKGYSLVYADSHGANLFFVRDDLLLKMTDFCFKNINEVEKIYKPINYKGYGLKYAHNKDPYKRHYISSSNLLKKIVL